MLQSLILLVSLLHIIIHINDTIANSLLLFTKIRPHKQFIVSQNFPKNTHVGGFFQSAI